MKKYISVIIYFLIASFLPLNITASVPDTMLYGFRFQSEYYGTSLDGTAPEATITLYDDTKKVYSNKHLLMLNLQKDIQSFSYMMKI